MAGDEGYIVEFIPVGNAVKVSAVDPETGLEAAIVGSPQASQEELTRLAVRKLDYLLEKRRDRPKDPGGRGGVMV